MALVAAVALVAPVAAVALVAAVAPVARQALRCRCARRGVCTQAPCYCIIMEFCAQGQLYEVLRAGRKVTPSLLVDWSMGIAGGMNYLHLHKIIHRDLKSPK